MKPIAVFYHCLFMLGEPPKVLEHGCEVVVEQMELLKRSGLLDAAKEFRVGINGGDESKIAACAFLPIEKGLWTFHGYQARNENRTIEMMREWARTHQEWNIIYFHPKSATHAAEDEMRTRWRHCMEKNVIVNWRQCVSDLDSGFDAVGCHYMEPPNTPEGQYIFAGNFYAVRASFLATLPSMIERDRIKMSGIDSLESRYEAEVIWGFGPALPRVKDYHGPNWNPGMTDTCAKL